MNAADWVIVGIVLLSILSAAAQGFLFEVISLAGLFVGYVLAAWRYPAVAAWFMPHVKEPWLADIAGFVIIFLVIMILAGVIGRIVRWLMKAAGLRWFDRVLGAAFGLLRGCLMTAILLLGFTAFAPESPWLQGSTLAPYFLVVARGASWLAPYEVRSRFRQGLDALNKLRHQEHGSAAPPGKPGTQ